MSEEKRIEDLEALYIEKNKALIESRERMIAGVEASAEKILSGISDLRSGISDLRNEVSELRDSFRKLEKRLVWMMIVFPSVGAAVVVMLANLFGVGGK